MALRIVTDSTADLSEELRREYRIEMVPLTVQFGSESHKDVVEMSIDDFWAKLKTDPHHPKTAQPAPGDFLGVYQRLHAEGHEILSIHLSEKLSGTVNSGRIAAQMLPEVQITVVDTHSVSLGLGMMCIQAARMARDGKSAAEIVAWLADTAKRTYILFTLDTLDFLQKNGRVGKAQALIGGLLGIKPILEIADGAVEPADKVRGKSKVLSRTLELLEERVPAGRRIMLGVVHAQVPEEAAAWVGEVKKRYTVAETFVAPIGPVIATNAGPGAIGILMFEV
jgi:DegV family protein with EDD domain